MAKKQKKQEEPSAFDKQLEQLPPELKEKFKKIQPKIESFKKELLKKFEDYIEAIALMPPPPGDDAAKKDEYHTLILVDDSDSTKMPKYELKTKLIGIVTEMAKKADAKIVPNVMLVSELWQSCYDAKYEVLQLIALSAPLLDKGILGAIKLTEVHKSMVLKKFEKYIVSYVLFGSLPRGEAKPDSDVDIAIVIDDTDVKKMTRAELKDKLRAIIISMGLQAGEITGIRNKLNIQPYILTDFWDGIKEANPVYFTVLRDGVPLHDRGMFMPWKQLLRMGKIKPSREAIDMFMATGEQMVSRVKGRLKELVESDLYWSTLTPSQAALMMYGIAPPTPNETINFLEEVFVKKEKLLEKKYVDIMRKIREYYKGIEHGTVKEITGKEVDELLKGADDYLKRIRKLFGEIELIKEKEQMIEQYETVVSIMRDVLILEGREKVTNTELIKVFENEIVSKGKVPAKYLRLINDLISAKKKYDTNKLIRSDVEKVRKSSKELIAYLVEYIQRKRGLELEKAKVRFKYGDKFGEVILLEDVAFITHDIDAGEKELSKAKIKKDGSLGTPEKCSIEEFEKHLSDEKKIPPQVFIKEIMFDRLKKMFGEDIEILMHKF